MGIEHSLFSVVMWEHVLHWSIAFYLLFFLGGAEGIDNNHSSSGIGRNHAKGNGGGGGFDIKRKGSHFCELKEKSIKKVLTLKLTRDCMILICDYAEIVNYDSKVYFIY